MKYEVFEDYHLLSCTGDFMLIFDLIKREPYESTNGILYQPMYIQGNRSLSFKRLDIMVASLFCPIPEDLIGDIITVDHIDGDLKNNNSSNLRWVKDNEIWKPLVYKSIVYTNYEVSSFGRVRNNRGQEISSEKDCETGYRFMTIRKTDGSRHRIGVHVVVAETFLHKPSDEHDCVNHIDGQKENNRIDNLEFVTKDGNNKHASMSWLRSKISIEIVFYIRKLLIEYNGSISKVLNELSVYGVTESMIHAQKRYMIEKLHTHFDIKHLIKISDEDHCIISDELIKYNGDANKVIENHLFKNDEITIYNIRSVRAELKSKGYLFPDGKRNRKISESKRMELIELMKSNEWSVSKVFKAISDDPSFKDVTVHDLKYIKRKYMDP